jgi:type IV pilus assembly protein PilM
MAKKVTLYIEDTEIKLLVTNGKQVEKWASLLLEPTLVRDGVIIDEDKVAEGIRTMFKLEGIGSKKVDVGLSGLNSIFRIVSMPELTPAMLPEAVMNEAGRVIPLPLDQVYLSYQKIPSPEGETRVFMMAYPRNSADTLIKTLISAGLKPQSMELAPLALCRCANAPKSIIINSWLTYLDIVVMADSMPQVIRSLSLPVDTTDINEKLPAITEELERTIAFYNSSNPDAPLDNSVPIFACGDLADHQEKWDVLADTTGYKVSALESPMESPEGFSSCKFMVNVGLALKGQVPQGEGSYYSIINIDAMPGIYKPPGISLVRILVPIMVVIALGAVAWGTYFVIGEYQDTDDLRSELAVKELQIEKKKVEALDLKGDKADLQLEKDAIIDDNDLLRYEIADWEDKIILQEEFNQQPIIAQQIAESLNARMTELTLGLDTIDDYLAEAVSLKLDTITLLNISYEGNNVALYGSAPTEGDIFAYAKALRSSSFFNTVIITSVVEAGGTYEFYFILH